MLELKMIPMQECQLLHSVEINKVISKMSPFDTFDFNENHILMYLNDVNGYLKEKKSKSLKEHFIIASSIYSFVKPLLGLQNVDDLKDMFVKIVQGAPYELENPLDIVFMKEPSESDMDLICLDYETIETENLEERVPIRSGNILKKRIKDELRANYQLLSEKMYDKIFHFSFIGYLDVCHELFLKDNKKRAYIEYDNLLIRTKGSFNIKIPHCLV